MPKRKCFVSYFHGDQDEVDTFIHEFTVKSPVFTPKCIGTFDNDDLIDSENPEYTMRRIREEYLEDSSVTIVLIGSCTHSRRYVDWEIKASLTQGESLPNGLIGIVLPSKGTSAFLPPRLKDNWAKGNTDCYARYYAYPSSPATLAGWIEDAVAARTARSEFISNSQDMMKHNAKCLICKETH